MPALSKLEYYLSEKGRFVSFPMYMMGYPLLAVSSLMCICFDFMGLTDQVSAPGLRIIGLLGIGISILCMFMFKKGKPRPSVGIFTILLIYAIAILMSAIPYMYYGFSVRASLFESVSGITTTGMSVIHLSDLNGPLLMWRAITGWIGGFLFVSLFCLYITEFGLPGRYLFAPGTATTAGEVYRLQVNKIVFRYGLIYFASTLIMTLLLMITGTEIIPSVRLAMSTVSTTGFMDMHGGLDSLEPASRAVIGIFMLISMINFMTIFYSITKRSLRPFAQDNEGLYMWIWLMLIGVIAFILLINYDLVPETADDYLNFVLVILSTASTTGFMVYDYSWPASIVLVFCLGAIIGGSIDSPTGGVKVARAAMALKIMKNEVAEVSFPNQVNTLRVRDVNVTVGLAYGGMLMMIMFFIMIITGTILISVTEIDMETALYLATSAITTTGKGLYSIGELGEINTFAQTVCAVLMLVGRLEVIIFVMMFSPAFWRDLFSRINLRKIISGRHPGF